MWALFGRRALRNPQEVNSSPVHECCSEPHSTEYTQHLTNCLSTSTTGGQVMGVRKIRLRHCVYLVLPTPQYKMEHLSGGRTTRPVWSARFRGRFTSGRDWPNATGAACTYPRRFFEQVVHRQNLVNIRAIHGCRALFGTWMFRATSGSFKLLSLIGKERMLSILHVQVIYVQVAATTYTSTTSEHPAGAPTSLPQWSWSS